MSSEKANGIQFDKFYNIIDGQQRGAEKYRHGVNPATKENLWDVPIATERDVNDAVAAGKKAFVSWSQTPIEKRKELMLKFMELYVAHKNDFANLLTLECGKPHTAAMGEVSGIKGGFQHHANLKLPVEKVESKDSTATTRYVPLGVVAAICPWNFPLSLSAGKIAPALITGCVIIVKPSPFTPYSALKFVELAQQVFPPGVVQAVGGNDDLGPMLTDHPDIAKISFTGSIATGKRIMAACAKTLKRITLELGGNDPCIIFPDIDLDKVVPQVATGAFWNTAQVCVATKRIYVHESIYRAFVDKMVAYTKTIKLGTDETKHGDGYYLGPIQNEMQYNKVKEFFADSKKHNYSFALGSADVASTEGFYISPTIIDNPPNDSRIITEEPFGPIVPIQPWSDLDEVITRANNSNAGLGASVWTSDVARGEAVALRLEAGNVFVNSWVKPSPLAYFSGHKESGIGGEWGTQGILSFCNAHVTHVFK